MKNIAFKSNFNIKKQNNQFNSNFNQKSDYDYGMQGLNFYRNNKSMMSLVCLCNYCASINKLVRAIWIKECKLQINDK